MKGGGAMEAHNSFFDNITVFLTVVISCLLTYTLYPVEIYLGRTQLITFYLLGVEQGHTRHDLGF